MSNPDDNEQTEASRGDIEEREPMRALAPPPQKPTHEDKTRRHITYGLLLLVAVLALLAYALVAADLVKVQAMTEILDKTFSPIMALAASAVGYYFGQGRRPK